MVTNKKLDVLLIGRPDHSMMIYDALTKQNSLSYRFIVFKCLPQWLSFITKKIRIQYVGKYAKIGIRATFINVFKYSFRFKFAQNWTEYNTLETPFRHITNSTPPRIIHYWHPYVDNAVNEYAKNNTEVVALHDIHMPAYAAVVKAMEDVAIKYNLPEITKRYISLIERQNEELRYVSDAIVPSTYVLNTYKPLFPNIKYHVVSYGIMKSATYVKHCEVRDGHRFKFVYVGRVSLEKGCDILFEFFKSHPEYELHVYGSMVESQEFIFEEFMSSNIVLHGTIAKSLIQTEVSKYDIGIHLSRFDAYSLGVSEIIGSGLPVIVSNTTGNEADILRYDLGEVTTNSLTDIEMTVKKLTITERYNRVIETIDRYLDSDQNITYGKKMISLYNNLLRR